jgi:hypothetical protein
VTIQGTVTSPLGLFDGDRRLTLQDGSGAILVRLPEGTTGPRVGSRLRVTGKVGTWYGGRQLEADEPATNVGRGTATPVVLRRAPGEQDEWRLVRVRVRIEDVSRDGDTWRAEASLGAAGSLPLVGIARSGIPSDVLVEGRSATITGIVKRAHPSASDQRFGIVPRDRHDIRLGREPAATSDATTGSDTGSGDVDPGAQDAPVTDGGAGSVPGDTVVSVSLRGAAAMLGHRVRVAGALRVIETPLLTLDDGSGRGLVRLLDEAPTFEPALRLGEVVNVTGTVARRDLGGWEIVADAEGLVRASALGLRATPAPTQDAALLPAPSPGSGAGAAAMDADQGTGTGPLPLLFALTVAVAVAAVVMLCGALALGRLRRRSGPPPGSPLDAP